MNERKKAIIEGIYLLGSIAAMGALAGAAGSWIGTKMTNAMLAGLNWLDEKL